MGLLARGFAVWCVIIIAESIHGTLRELLLRPRVGDVRARQIAFFTGMAIILGLSWWLIRWVRADSPRQLWLVGVLWMSLTLAFEVVLGLFALGFSAQRILDDYNPARGGLMGFGLVWLLLAPTLASLLRKQNGPAG